MKITKKYLLPVAIPSLLMLLQACNQGSLKPETDPIFSEKKRPARNQVLLNKAQSNESDYQEVNSTFVNDYQKTKRIQSEELFVPKKSQETLSPIQKIREEANKSDLYPIQPIVPSDREYKPMEAGIVTTQSQPAATYGDTFEIQAGSYQSEAGAMKIVQKFESSGVRNIRIDKVENKNTIRINNNGQPFKTRDEASKVMQDIIEKTQHYDIMVVKNKI